MSLVSEYEVFVCLDIRYLSLHICLYRSGPYIWPFSNLDVKGGSKKFLRHS